MHNQIRKPKNWEPQYIQVPVTFLQEIVQDVVDVTLSSYQGGGSGIGGDVTVINLLNAIKDNLMALSSQVQDLVNEVTDTKSIEQASAAALAELVKQAADLNAQVAALTAAGTGMSADDAAAISQATKDLSDSAAALQAAVPANAAPSSPPAADSSAPATDPNAAPPASGS